MYVGFYTIAIKISMDKTVERVQVNLCHFKLNRTEVFIWSLTVFQPREQLTAFPMYIWSSLKYKAGGC